MKIAMLTHILHPIKEPFAGGLEAITSQMCDTLLERGYDIDIYAHQDSTFSKPHQSIISQQALEECARMDGSDRERYLNRVYHNCLMDIYHSRKYDLVHNLSLDAQPVFWASTSGIPFITSLHTPPFQNLVTHAGLAATNPFYSVTSVSHSLARDWQDIYSKVDVIYNGIDVKKWQYNGVPEEFAFWYGRICPEKAPHRAIDICQQNSYPLILAGPISNRKYYEDVIKNRINTDHIQYIGHLSQEDISVHLRRAKFTFFTSEWNEPYGLVVAESLSCGTPVICGSNGAPKEIINDRCGIVIDDWNNVDFQAIQKSISQMDRKDCRSRAEAFCSIDSMVDAYENYYQKTVDHANRILRS